MPKSLHKGSWDFIILKFFLNKSLNEDVILIALNVKDFIKHIIIDPPIKAWINVKSFYIKVVKIVL